MKEHKVIGYYKDSESSWCVSVNAKDNHEAMKLAVRDLYTIQKIHLFNIVIVAILVSGFVHSIDQMNGEEVLARL